MTYLDRWVDPNALAQLVGALVGAAIAISLWFAEKRRQENLRRQMEAERDRRFRLTLRSAVSRLKQDIENFNLQRRATQNELEAKVENCSLTKQDSASSITSFLDRFRINVPNTFEFSEIHVLALDTNTLDALSTAKDALQELFGEIRLLRKTNITGDQGEILDSFGELHERVKNVIEQIDALLKNLNNSLK
jgi:hypothetical protein